MSQVREVIVTADVAGVVRVVDDFLGRPDPQVKVKVSNLSSLVGGVVQRFAHKSCKRRPVFILMFCS